jgi:hypothetical protein
MKPAWPPHIRSRCEHIHPGPYPFFPNYVYSHLTTRAKETALTQSTTCTLRERMELQDSTSGNVTKNLCSPNRMTCALPPSSTTTTSSPRLPRPQPFNYKLGPNPSGNGRTWEPPISIKDAQRYRTNRSCKQGCTERQGRGRRPPGHRCTREARITDNGLGDVRDPPGVLGQATQTKHSQWQTRPQHRDREGEVRRDQEGDEGESLPQSKPSRTRPKTAETTATHLQRTSTSAR